MKKPSEKNVEAQISEVMGLLGKRSAEVRQKKWGKREFTKRMREYGKLGGRPKKDNKNRKGK
jgi:ribosomal protein S6